MDKFPSRIVCLTEETTELLYLLGEEKRIVGVSGYTVRPKRAKKEKPIVSAFIQGNIKKIKSLNPDLVLGFSDIQSDLASKLIQEGLNVFITNQRSISEIFQTMFLLGRMLGCEKKVTELIQSWKEKISRIQKQNKKYRKKVFFQEWDEPIITGIEWVSELIEIVGGEDIFEDKRKGFLAKDRIVTLKEIVKKNPDIIIGSWCGKKMNKQWIYDQKELSNVSAVKNNQIFEIDSSIILQPGPALFLEGIDLLQRYVQ